MYFCQLPDISRSPGGGDGSPVLGRALLTQATITTNDMDSPPPRSLKPDYIKGTAKLSPQGKTQVYYVCGSICAQILALNFVNHMHTINTNSAVLIITMHIIMIPFNRLCRG